MPYHVPILHKWRVCEEGACFDYYDQKNLLKPATHTKGGARLYTDQDFAKLQQILLLKYAWC